MDGNGCRETQFCVLARLPYYPRPPPAPPSPSLFQGLTRRKGVIRYTAVTNNNSSTATTTRRFVDETDNDDDDVDDD